MGGGCFSDGGGVGASFLSGGWTPCGGIRFDRGFLKNRRMWGAGGPKRPLKATFTEFLNK